jgi:predicted nucleotide-binding protein
MNTTESTPSSAADADAQAIIEHMMTGKPLDPAVYQRVRARGEQITERLRREHGEMNIAVDLIREIRDEAP